MQSRRAHLERAHTATGSLMNLYDGGRCRNTQQPNTRGLWHIKRVVLFVLTSSRSLCLSDNTGKIKRAFMRIFIFSYSLTCGCGLHFVKGSAPSQQWTFKCLLPFPNSTRQIIKYIHIYANGKKTFFGCFNWLYCVQFEIMGTNYFSNVIIL